MKTRLFYLIGLFSIFVYKTAYSQEEFFENQSGIIISGISNRTGNYSGLGIDGYLRNGTFFGLSVESFHPGSTPLFVASLGFLNDMGCKNRSLKLGLGFSYGKTTGFNIGAAHISIIKCFLKNSTHPCSLSANYSGELLVNENEMASSIMVHMVGLNFNQALFVKKRLSPILGVSQFWDMSDFSNHEFCLNLGLNIRIGKLSETTMGK